MPDQPNRDELLDARRVPDPSHARSDIDPDVVDRAANGINAPVERQPDDVPGEVAATDGELPDLPVERTTPLPRFR